MGDGNRNSLLTKRHLIETLLLGVIGPVACVRVTWWVLDRATFVSPSTHIFGGAALLAVLSFMVTVSRPLDAIRAAPRRTSTGLPVTVLCGFIVLAVVARIDPAIIVAPIGIATLAAATSEELVFRRWVPSRLEGTVGDSRIVASVLIPQVVFALAHAVNPSFIAAKPMEFVVLFVAGLLYQGVANTGGIAMAAAVHGALNLSLAAARG